MKLKNLKVGRKIGLGFGLVLLLMAAAGVMTYTGVGGIVSNAREVIGGNRLDGNLAQKEVDHLVWAGKVNDFVTDASVSTLDVQLDPKKCGFGKWYYGDGRLQAEALVPSLAPLLAEIEKPHIDLHQSAAKIKQVYRQPHPGLLMELSSILVKHLEWANDVCRQINLVFQNETAGIRPNYAKFQLGVQTDPNKCALGLFLQSEDMAKIKAQFPEIAKAVAELNEPHNRLHASAVTIQNLVRAGQVNQAARVFQNETLPALTQVHGLLEQCIRAEEKLQDSADEAMAIYTGETRKNLHAVQDLLTKIRAEAKAHILSDQAMLDAAEGTRAQVIVITLAALVVGALVAVFLTLGITRPLAKANRAINTVSEGDFTMSLDAEDLDRRDELGQMLGALHKMSESLSATVREVIQATDTVASSAAEISQGNQDLSERTQQQAAGIEETASALEEMTSSVKQNAANSSQANKLASTAATMAHRGGEVLQRTVEAMSEVSDSSGKIADIINVVNDIAFQTNLLALNAAVEAARAGEAGRGFAVVAGEVRNLAGRSASAAKEIQALISDSVGKVDHGNALVAESGQLLRDIIENVERVATAIDDITAASQEQAQGIDEVNRAVTLMDQAVQQNAALVEEAAAASENTAAAAEELRNQMSQFKV